MQLPLRLWKKTLATLGCQIADTRHSRDHWSRTRTSARRWAARHRKLVVEQLEPLNMLTGITVEADAPSCVEGETAWFTFTLSEPAPEAFSIDLLLSGGPAGPTGYVMPIAQGQTSAHVDFPTTDNSTPDDSYTLNLEITGSSQSGPSGPFDSASTEIVDNDGQSGPSGPSGPTVEVSASGPAHEVGPVPADFVFYRSGAETTAPLTIQFAISGSASNGQDYLNLSTSITIPANQLSATLVMTPITDTTVEGIETVVITISANAAYTLGNNVEATVDIRDRAGVKQLVATSGVTGIPAGPDTWRDVTNGELMLTQDDAVDFRAIPTDGGDFAPNEPVWTVTGEGGSTGETRTVTFGTYRPPDETTVSVTTPADTAPKTVDVGIVPYPTGLAYTAIENPIVNYLPGAYGTDYKYALSPSTGADAADLVAFNGVGLLKIKEYVTLEPPYTYGMIGWPGPFETEGDLFDDDDQADVQAVIKDKNTAGRDVIFPYSQLFRAAQIPPIVFHQDLLWKSTAPDSLNQGWHEFVTDNPMSHTLSASGNGFVVTTSSGGVDFEQPHSAPALDAQLTAIPDGANPAQTYQAGPLLYLRLQGAVELTQADIDAGSKSFTITVYDNDPFPNLDELMDTIEITVPAANGVPGMFTPFIATTWAASDLWAPGDYRVYGPAMISTGEQEAEIYYVIEGGMSSNTVSVQALP